MAYLISPKVHRSLYQNAIKKFIEDMGIDTQKIAEDNKINLEEDLAYSRLLDILVDEGSISPKEINNFLLGELNYGKMKNIYINLIEDVDHLKNDKDIIFCINSMDKYEIINSASITSNIFIDDLASGISPGEIKLLYFEIIKDNDNKIEKINILIADFIHDKDGKDCNNYYPIEINIKDKLLIIRLRNWVGNIDDESLDNMYNHIELIITQSFALVLKPMTVIAQKIVYSMISSLINVILKKPMEYINGKIGLSVEKQIKEWAKFVVQDDKKITDSDYDVIKQIIINNYCKYYMIYELGNVKAEDIYKKYGVDGYPRYIRFIDDTVSEGRAKSPDTRESLLETSIFYDVKARLDQSKAIKLLTIYWLTCKDCDFFGVSIYTCVQGKFKVIFLPHYYSKEMYEYVLQQIKRNIPETRM